jgi:hypothetical protein
LSSPYFRNERMATSRALRVRALLRERANNLDPAAPGHGRLKWSGPGP